MKFIVQPQYRAQKFKTKRKVFLHSQYQTLFVLRNNQANTATHHYFATITPLITRKKKKLPARTHEKEETFFPSIQQNEILRRAHTRGRYLPKINIYTDDLHSCVQSGRAHTRCIIAAASDTSIN